MEKQEIYRCNMRFSRTCAEAKDQAESHDRPIYVIEDECGRLEIATHGQVDCRHFVRAIVLPREE